jgi:CheY-like chemotaxis protein
MPEALSATAQARRRPLIMIVDDEVALRRVLGMLLTREGFEVVTTAGGPEALEKYDAGLRPDLALIDFRMPEMDGGHVLRELKARGYSARALLISASVRTEQSVLEMGFDGFVTKPYQIQTLLGRLRELVPAPPGAG